MKTTELLKELMANATPGPWEFDDLDNNQFVNSDTRIICALPGIHPRTADFKFIAESRNALPALIAAAEALRGILVFGVFIDSITAGRAAGCKEAFAIAHAALKALE